VGVASEADIVFVQIRLRRAPDGRQVLDVNDVIDAVAFIFQVAEEAGQPCVVNLSLNTMSGPHDGDGHFEQSLAAIAQSGSAGPQCKGRAVVVAAGNLPDADHQDGAWQHIADTVRLGQPFGFEWRVPAGDKTRNSVEIWYDAVDTWLQVTLVPGSGAALQPVGPGQAGEIICDGKPCGSIIGSRPRPTTGIIAATALDTAPGRHVILLDIDPAATDIRSWKAVLECVDDKLAPAKGGTPVSFHAWLERDDDGQSGIFRTGASPIETPDVASTIGTLSCSAETIVVGAYSTVASAVDRWGYTSHGPGRHASIRKPDISAPGNGIWLSKPERDPSADRCMRASGTSMAAPFVTGTIACIYQVEPTATLATVRQALQDTARPPIGATTSDGWSASQGKGHLNPSAALAWVKQLP
jgi:subtilisin family serine protease